MTDDKSQIPNDKWPLLRQGYGGQAAKDLPAWLREALRTGRKDRKEERLLASNSSHADYRLTDYRLLSASTNH
jgi:hypothetical protein